MSRCFVLFSAYGCEPFDAMYGDIDVDFTKTNEAQCVNVGDGGGDGVIIMRGHTFEEWPIKCAVKGLHSTTVLAL